MLCNVNRSYVFVQSVRHFSCQTRSVDIAVLRRSDTDAIFIDDFITTNNSLILIEIKGRKVVSWKIWCSHFTNFLRHLCQCMLYMQWAFLDTFWAIFRTWRQRCTRRLWRKQKCFLPLTPFYSNVHVHTPAGAHIHAHSHKSTYTLNLFPVFSLADSVPNVHLQG